MSGTNFIHGIVLISAMVVLGTSHTLVIQTISFIGVLIATINAVGGYVVTLRMLSLFKKVRIRKGCDSFYRVWLFFRGYFISAGIKK